MPKSINSSHTLTQLQTEVEQLEQALIELIRSKTSMTSTTPSVTKPASIQQQQMSIAIVGMASVFPRSRNLQQYWSKIVEKEDCITDVPPSRWNVEDYYDPDPTATDKTYCKRGGFIPEIDFNPMEFGLPPNQLEVTDISQLLGLVVAKEALADAGYEDKPFNRERTGVVLGVALARQLTMPLAARLQYPVWEKALKSSGLSDADTQKIIEKIKSAYINWEPNAFPGMLANIVSGRIANRFDLGGMNCIVDAACASSFGALSMAISELTSGRADMMLTGGVDTDNSIMAYMCFSKTPAVSRSEQTKPFDANSDGMMLGEGVGILVLKRLEDAERDSDRIYAVIKGIGSSSDGRHKSIYAPRPEGQMRALRRAYQEAGFSPNTVGAIEAHGTGTMAGDPAEFAALKAVFSENKAGKQQIALGSVKSQIGHTKAAAGAASLIKTALALHHKILPPTINVTKPHPKLEIEDSPFYLNTETRPWLQSKATPRRAGVSSFGFGGTNYHIVLEEYLAEHQSVYRLHNTPQAILLAASTPQELLAQCRETLQQLQSESGERYLSALMNQSKTQTIPLTAARLGFVAASLTEAINKLEKGINCLTKQPQEQYWEHPFGIFYRQTGIETQGKVVALFSGQGSQYLEMGKELASNFPCVQASYSSLDRLFENDGLPAISGQVFPPPVFDEVQRQKQAEALQQTEIAQGAIAALSVGSYKILQQAGFKPDFVAGHSFGELTALWAAQVLSDEDYFFLVKERGQAMATPTADSAVGAMLAVKGDLSQIEKVIKDFPHIAIANWNSPQQLVLAGDKAAIVALQEILEQQGYSAIVLPVSAAFHTLNVEHAQQPFAQAVEAVTFKQPQIPVFTNVSGNPYPNEPQDCQKILKQHLLNQVLFQEEIENIYAAGGTCFVEFGPRSILTNLVKEILGDRHHLAVAVNGSRQKDSDRQLREAVVQLRVAGLSLSNLDPYQIEPTPQPEKHPLNVSLSSVNYVSPKTQQSFEQALQNRHQLSPEKTTTANQNGHSKELATMKDEFMISVTDNHGENTSQLSAPSIMPLERILASLEYSLTQFNQHQQETLAVHRQYLEHQTQYAQTFFQLMQQQNQLWTNVQTAPQEIELKTAVLESVERSLIKFQEHQTDTLRVHEQYLHHQTEYAKNFFLLTQQSYSQLLKGDLQLSAVESTEMAFTQSDRLIIANSNLPVKNITTIPVASNGNGNTNHHELKTTTNGNGYHNHEANEPQPTITPVVPLSSTSATITALSIPQIDVALLSQTLLNVVSDKTGYPTEMLELEMDLEADLGIDSIKRVEILGALQEEMPDLPQPNLEDLGQLRNLSQIIDYLQSFAVETSNSIASNQTEPVETTPPATFEATLLEIVSQQTGYPSRTFNLEMNLEADLGIDLIKRQAILAALKAKMPKLLQTNREKLEVEKLTTLGQIIEYLNPEKTQKKTALTLNQIAL